MSAAFVPSEDTVDLAGPDDSGVAEFRGFADGYPATFELYVDDDRYSVPTLHLVTARDAQTAVALAEARLADSAHHRGVELWQSGRRLLALGAPRRHGG